MIIVLCIFGHICCTFFLVNIPDCTFPQQLLIFKDIVRYLTSSTPQIKINQKQSLTSPYSPEKESRKCCKISNTKATIRKDLLEKSIWIKQSFAAGACWEGASWLGRWREKQSQTGRKIYFRKQIVIRLCQKITINVKRINHREAVIVMPGHTTAVKGVVFQDQFVR